MPRKRERPVVMGVFSDVHAGSTLALCPDQVPLEDGNFHVSGKVPRWLMQCWRTYWETVAQRRDANDAELYAVSNGDLVEGDHHGTSKIISRNLGAQKWVAAEVLKVPLALKPDRLVVIRGTEAHVGESGASEESIADGLKRDKRPVVCDPDTNATSWWHWRPEIQGVKMDFTHHGRIGQREHTRASQIVLYAHDIHLAHTKNGEQPPALAFRGHNHKAADSYDAVKPRVIATGTFQAGGTGYVKKVQPDSLADIQAVIVTIRNGEYDIEKVHFHAERPVWKP